MQRQVANDILIPEFFRLLEEGHEVRFTPSGVSMRPWIEGERDSVVLRRLERPARRGDILLAKMLLPNGETTYVLHRVRRIEEAGKVLVLQGDGNLQGEERVSPENVIGVVSRIEMNNGRKKPLLKGVCWQTLLPIRGLLLKVYRHTLLKWMH